MGLVDELLAPRGARIRVHAPRRCVANLRRFQARAAMSKPVPGDVTSSRSYSTRAT